MSLTELLPYVSLHSIVSLLMVFGAGLVAALALLGLRFARRGTARFWLAPSFVTLAWLPLVAGAGLAALGVVRVAEAVALVGTGSTAAVQAGLTEAELPVLLGLLGTAGVAGLGLALLAVGRSRQAVSPSPEPASFVPPAVAVSAISLGLALAFHAVAPGLATSPSSATAFARALAWSAAGVFLLAPIAAFTLALRAPRGSVPAPLRALSLGALGVLVACALAVAAARIVWLQRAPLGEGSTAATEPVESPGLLPGEPPAPGPSRVEAKKLKNVPPGYPPAALQARLQGTVILECLIGEDGRVARVKVLRGVPLLDEAATEAVRQWEYEPTQINGVPVPVIMTVTVNFNLS